MSISLPVDIPVSLPVDIPVEPPGFTRRLARRIWDPTLLALPVVAAVFVGLRAHHLVADLPIWVILGLLAASYLLSAVVTAAWPPGQGGWRMWVRVSCELGAIGLVIYGVGWGATLGLGLLFGVADSMRSDGSRIEAPAQVASLAVIGLGQVAVAFGAVPSLVQPPLVHALAGLAALGLVLTIRMLASVHRRRELAQAEVTASERRFRALVQRAADPIVVVGPEGHISYASPAFFDLLGYSPADIAGLDPPSLAHPDDLDKTVAALDSGELTNKPVEIRLRNAEGDWRWFELKAANRLEDPDVAGVVANLHDIHDQKLAEEARREAEERFRRSFEEAPIGMVLTSSSGHILRANRSFAHIVGRDLNDLAGTHVTELTHPEDRQISLTQMSRLLAGELERYQLEKRYVRPDGQLVWVSVTASCVRAGDGQALYVVGQVQDITEQREMRQRLEHNAIHDALTGLPNRLLFSDRLEVALSHTGRSESKVAVIFCDLDRFKWINDSLGHELGDRVLVAVAERLRSVVRHSDTLARFGGDEFTLLCEVADRSEALDLAERVAACMQLPLRLDGSEIYVTASFGVAISGGAQDTAEALMRRADLAMYKAKELGRARVECYEEDDATLSVTRLQMGTELHGAIKRSEFELYYQPMVDLHRRAVLGVEALVRWRHPRRGLLLPAHFIPLAEDSGIMIPLGAWVLRRACSDLVHWEELRAAAGCRPHPFVVGVNVSAVQLSDNSFPAQVAEILEDTGVNPDQIWLEITESALMRDPEEAARQLARLRSLGVHLAVDDFGTGYSSLSYLRSFPVEALKIDRSFVEDLGRDPKSAAIVRAVVELSEALGVVPVAEGIERLTQASELKALGCNLGQGFLFCQPRPFRPGEFPGDDLASFAATRAASLASAG